MEKGSSMLIRIREGMWRDSLAPFGNKIGNGAPLERINQNWVDVWDKVSIHAETCKVLGHTIFKTDERVKPVSLEEMDKTIDILENWVAKNGHILTFPPSSFAWKKAVEQTIIDNDIDSLVVLVAAFPQQIKETISKIKLTDNKASKWLSTIQLKTEEELNPEKQKEILDKNLSINPITPIKEERKAHFSKEENDLFEYLIEVFKDLRNNGKENSVNKENLDAKIKEWLNKEGQTVLINDLFEEALYGAIIKMPLNDLETFAKFWPGNKKFKIADSLSLFSSPKFWGLMKYPENAERTYLLDNLLPALITISDLPFSMKYQIGKEVLTPVKKNPEIFRQRLSFWSAIGGSLNDTKPNKGGDFYAAQEDIFVSSNNAPKEDISLSNWILKQQNPMWTKELHHFLKDVVGIEMENVNKAYQEVMENEVPENKKMKYSKI